MSLDDRTLQKPFRKLRKLVKKLPSLPTPEQVHDVRTNTRKIEAATHALMLDSRRNEKRLVKELKPVRRSAGRVRDLDVLTGFVAKLRPQEDEECQVELLEHLGEDRYRQARKLDRQVRRHGSEIRQRLKRSSQFLKKKLDSSGNGQGEWPADAAAVALQLANEVRQWPQLNARNLHPFRLKVKELRYVLQLAASTDQDLVEKLGEVKDAVGEWHDWQELGGIADRVLDHGPGCEVIKAIRSITKAKFEQGLALANKLRTNYFEATRRPAPGRRTATAKPPAAQGALTLAA